MGIMSRDQPSFSSIQQKSRVLNIAGVIAAIDGRENHLHHVEDMVASVTDRVQSGKLCCSPQFRHAIFFTMCNANSFMKGSSGRFDIRLLTSQGDLARKTMQVR